MTIVCGTDFSQNAGPGLAAAAALASRLRAPQLSLVHVLDPSVDVLGERLRDEAMRIARQRLEADAARLQARTEARVHAELLTGHASDKLLAHARELRAQMIVVGAQGHALAPLYRLGGTAERLARQSEVPVLVVHDSAPFEAWARGERPLRVVLGVDWTASSEPAIRWVQRLRRAGPCRVTIGHVYYPDEARRRYGLPSTVSPFEVDPALEELLRRDLVDRVGPLEGEGEVACRPTLALGRAGDHLLALAQAEQADLIAIGTHHPRGLARLASVSTVVLHFSPVSVACVGAPAEDEVVRAPVGPLRRVLVPTDLSAFANQAIAFGCRVLAGPEGGDLHLLHVVPPAPGPAGTPKPDVAALEAELRPLVLRARGSREIRSHVEVVVSDDTAAAICMAAERVGADVLCMASHGRSGIPRAVLGSVADAVTRRSRIPVCIVRPLPE